MPTAREPPARGSEAEDEEGAADVAAHLAPALRENDLRSRRREVRTKMRDRR